MLSEISPESVKVGCLSHSRLGKRPQSRSYTYAGKNGIYFSKTACIDVGISSTCFPKPMEFPPSPTIKSVTCNAVHPDPQNHKIEPPANRHKSEYPKTPPFPITSDNIEKLKQCLFDQFVTTVYTNSGKFPAMSSSPAYIYLCTEAENWYAAIEDEAPAISWLLEKCCIFIMGCTNVILVTDH